MPSGYRRSFSLVICSVFAFLAAAAQAQVNHPYNEVGIYTVEQPDGCATAQVDVPVATPFTCYVVLANPWNETLGRPVTTVGGAEFRLELPGDLYLLGAYYPVPQTGWPEPPDFAYGTRAPVVDGFCTLMTLRLMTVSEAPRFASLMPVLYMPPTIPGDIVFADYDDGFSAHVMHPVSGSPDVPVFAVNWDGDLSFCETVPDEGASFGGVKALYR